MLHRKVAYTYISSINQFEYREQTIDIRVSLSLLLAYSINRDYFTDDYLII